MNEKLAYSVIIQHIMAAAAERVEWEDYPEIGEYDWDDIGAKLDSQFFFPNAELYKEAYDFLTNRAEK